VIYFIKYVNETLIYFATLFEELSILIRQFKGLTHNILIWNFQLKLCLPYKIWMWNNILVSYFTKVSSLLVYSQQTVIWNAEEYFWHFENICLKYYLTKITNSLWRLFVTNLMFKIFWFETLLQMLGLFLFNSVSLIFIIIFFPRLIRWDWMHLVLYMHWYCLF
jgi:hypothetical protein